MYTFLSFYIHWWHWKHCVSLQFFIILPFFLCIQLILSTHPFLFIPIFADFFQSGNECRLAYKSILYAMRFSCTHISGTLQFLMFIFSNPTLHPLFHFLLSSMPPFLLTTATMMMKNCTAWWDEENLCVCASVWWCLKHYQ